jgi:hypothetical protein
MANTVEEMRNIRLGEQYWCVLKTTIVDPNKTDYPEFLVHLAKGYVTSKGIQKEPGSDTGAITPYVEIAGQRVRHDHVFETAEEAIEKANSMMRQLVPAQTQPEPENAVPPQA